MPGAKVVKKITFAAVMRTNGFYRSFPLSISQWPPDCYVRKHFSGSSFLMTSLRTCKSHLFYHREYLREFSRTNGVRVLQCHLQAAETSRVRVANLEFAI